MLRKKAAPVGAVPILILGLACSLGIANEAYAAAPTSALAEHDVPLTRTVWARVVGVAPGAIVCADASTVQEVYELYVQAWSDERTNALTHGQSRLIQGEPFSKPVPEDYGCELVPNGTPMTMETGNIVPVVSVRLRNGKWIRGVTLPAMITRQNQTQ